MKVTVVVASCSGRDVDRLFKWFYANKLKYDLTIIRCDIPYDHAKVMIDVELDKASEASILKVRAKVARYFAQ